MYFFWILYFKLLSQLAPKRLFFSGKSSCFQTEMEVTYQLNKKHLYFLEYVMKMKNPKF